MAILMVLFSHTTVFLPFPLDIKQQLFAYFGYVGVELFFVLSGFLVGGLLFEQFSRYGISGNSIYHFWIRRWFRTLPGYYLALIIYLALDYFSLGAKLWEQPFVATYLFFGQNWFQPHPYFFPIAWSLSIEEWFYLLLPFWVLLGYKCWGMDKTKWIKYTGIILLLYPLIRLLPAWSVTDWDYDLRMRVPFRFDALLLGVFVWLYMDKYPVSPSRKKQWGLIGIFLLIGMSAYFFIAYPPANGAGNWFAASYYFTLVSLAVALTIPWLSDPGLTGSGKGARVIRFISRISYSLYLSHVFSIYVATTLINKWIGGPSNGLKWIFSWVLSLLVAAVLYRVYEKPMMDLRDRFRLPGNQPVK